MQAVPTWFQADQIYNHGSQWFIGSQSSLHIGPYADEKVAQSKSDEFSRRLKKMLCDGDRLRYVRKLLNEEWTAIGDDLVMEVEEIDMQPVQDPVRQGEAQKHWYRSERFFQVDGIWFFTTRENIDVGPYDSESEARRHERKLKSKLIRCRDVEEARKTIMEYKHRPEEIDPGQVKIQGLKQFSWKGF